MFLTVYTNTYRRPTLLEACEASVAAQSEPVQHLVIRDEVGIGIDGVYAEVPEHVGEVVGEYVLMLNDDNVLLDSEFAADLRAHVEEQGFPDVVIMQMLLVDRLLPDFWGEAPRCGHIDLANYVVRRDVWARHAADFGRRYEGDYDFIRRLWEAGYEFDWWPRMGVMATQIGRGLPEAV